jgi:hypothetical protein
MHAASLFTLHGLLMLLLLQECALSRISFALRAEETRRRDRELKSKSENWSAAVVVIVSESALLFNFPN